MRTTTPAELAAHIRKGLKGTTHIVAALLYVEESGAIKCCGLGAAIVGKLGKDYVRQLAKRVNNHWDATFRRLFPGLPRTKVTCPGCGERQSIVEVAVCLNDQDGWTRERIAHWLRLVKLPPAKPKVTRPSRARAAGTPKAAASKPKFYPHTLREQMAMKVIR